MLKCEHIEHDYTNQQKVELILLRVILCFRQLLLKFCDLVINNRQAVIYWGNDKFSRSPLRRLIWWFWVAIHTRPKYLR